MKKRMVIYHANCRDGFTAAWVAWRLYKDGHTEYLPAQYGDAPPDVTDREVLIVDFSYPRDTLRRMAEAATSIRVLDHHKTAQADLEGVPFATFDMNRSGAGIAWDVLHASEARPWLVDYVEDRDLWRFALPDSKEVNAWIAACRSDTFEQWDELEALGVRKAAERGIAVNAFIDRYVHDTAATARLVVFEGHTIPIVNAAYVCISELVGKLAETAPFALGWQQRADGLYQYSLRSRGDAVDVSEIAKRYGGGGHRNAAGFTSQTLLPL
jgi:uncharacterized protein